MLQPSQRLGDFEIVRRLGKGGMGEVYEAQQLHPPRPVAVKILAPWLAENDEALNRFWREAAVPGRLDHPNIVRIIATGKTDDGTAFYAMQLVRGVSLAGLIRKAAQLAVSAAPTSSEHGNGGHTPEAALSPALPAEVQFEDVPAALLDEYRTDRFRLTARLGLQAARALAHAHQQGCLHRDVKPSNLMVDHQGQLYLVDFGLTRALDAGGMHTRAGALLGTPWYMSPEQSRGEAVDCRSDVYALGVTLYELATGGTGPFTAARDDSEAVLAQVRAGAHLPLRLLAPGIPHRLEQAIVRAMQPRARRRHAHAGELAADLEHFLKKAPNPSATPECPPSSRWRLAGKKGRWLAAALLLLAVMAAGGYLASRHFGGAPGGTPPPRSDHPGNPAPAPPRWPDDYPRALRDRAAGKTLVLIGPRPEQRGADAPADPARGVIVFQPPLPADQPCFLPLWCRRVAGDGKYYAFPNELDLKASSREGAGYTLLALDDDLARRPFELTVELQQTGARNPLGVFFGWERSGAGAGGARALVVQLDERPLPAVGRPHGQVVVGVAQIPRGRDGKAAAGTLVPPGPLPDNVPRVLPLSKSGVWHRVTVRATPGKVVVTVDEERAVEFAPPFGPGGPLGIWAQEGTGQFGRVTVTALPAAGTN